MQDYGLDESFFKEIDSSIKKTCKTQNDIKTYYIQFQGFTTDLFTLIGNLMQWKMQAPAFLKKLLYNVTKKRYTTLLPKRTGKMNRCVKQHPISVNIRQHLDIPNVG